MVRILKLLAAIAGACAGMIAVLFGSLWLVFFISKNFPFALAAMFALFLFTFFFVGGIYMAMDATDVNR